MFIKQLLVCKKELKSLFGIPYSFQHIARLEAAAAPFLLDLAPEASGTHRHSSSGIGYPPGCPGKTYQRIDWDAYSDAVADAGDPAELLGVGVDEFDRGLRLKVGWSRNPNPRGPYPRCLRKTGPTLFGSGTGSSI